MSLYMQELLNPIFHDGAWLQTRRHPDATRQRKARRWARQLAQARALKARTPYRVPKLPSVVRDLILSDLRRGVLSEYVERAQIRRTA